jgi:predicted 2-oxoglutarate/Fe(II)-dependent dioxygenase YbiX
MTNLHVPPKGNKYLKTPVVLKNKFTREECLTLINTITSEISPADPKKAIALNLVRGNEWIFEKITRILDEVNNQYYHFDLTDLRTLNFLIYRPEDSLPWHRDIGTSDKNFMTRKLTLVLFLSDINDYEGGALGFIPDISFKLVQEQGSVILYPSFIVHRVEKVTKGVRYIIIASAHGQPFR